MVKRTIIKIYRNKRNKNKFLEVHDDGYHHNSVRQFMHWKSENVKNSTGDGRLHRWKISNLKELLEDYDYVCFRIGGR